MIEKLHEKITEFCPIDGIADNGDGTFRIDFNSECTEEQKQKAENVVTQWPLILAKESKLKIINNEWQKLLVTGWNCGQGHLGLSASDVALLSGAFTLAKEAAALGYPIPPLVTLENNLINFASIHEMTGLLLQYGAARSAMSVTFAERRKAAENATTLEELEAI